MLSPATSEELPPFPQLDLPHVHAYSLPELRKIIGESDDKEISGIPVKRSDYSSIRNSFFYSHRHQNETFFSPHLDEKKTSKSFQRWRREPCIITTALFYSIKTPLSEPLNN